MSIDMNLIFNLLLLLIREVVPRCIKINAERKQSHVSELLEKQKSIIKVEEALTNFSRLASKSYRYEGLELRQKIPKHRVIFIKIIFNPSTKTRKRGVHLMKTIRTPF